MDYIRLGILSNGCLSWIKYHLVGIIFFIGEYVVANPGVWPGWPWFSSCLDEHSLLVDDIFLASGSIKCMDMVLNVFVAYSFH